MGNYHNFVLPFTIGFAFMAVVLIVRYFSWFRGFSGENRKRITHNFFSMKTLAAAGEIFNEALLHLKIYKAKPLLGFMHMSLAFGWFMLIVGGKFESLYYTGSFFDKIWEPIFMRYFEPGNAANFVEKFFFFFMDFSLLLVLTGLMLAIAKRIRKSIMGMKNTTKHPLGNRIALTALWFIFPLRLLAESASSDRKSTRLNSSH